VTQALPEQLIACFRSVAHERLAKIEQAWTKLTQDPTDAFAAQTLSRELHTLKGESRSMGFADVNLVCHKLEEMIERAQAIDFRVSDNLDLVMVSAVQFVSMLLRKKPGQSFGGIDLPGFLRQIDEALLETQRAAPTSATMRIAPSRRPGENDVDRVSAETCRELAVMATSVYCEKLGSTGPRAARLDGMFRKLARTVARVSSVPFAELAARHVRAAVELARDLGRSVQIEVDAGDLRVSTGVVEAVDLALLHVLRNAVDHGIETEQARAAAGKPPGGRIRVSAARASRGIAVSIEDDGRGIDLERVRQRAQELRLLSSVEARRASPDALFSILFIPGFSTRDSASDVSGRGVGLDAVRAAVELRGGSVRFSSKPGRGTTIEMRLPDVGWTIGVHAVRTTGGAMLALPDSCSVSFETSDAPVIELATLLGVSSGHSLPPPMGDALLLTVKTSSVAFKLPVTSRPLRTTAERRCPTGPEDPLEVVAIAGDEALLLHPPAVYRSAFGAEC
jgi:two-component system, chemotaxis family, sensor kinase CheA